MSDSLQLLGAAGEQVLFVLVAGIDEAGDALAGIAEQGVVLNHHFLVRDQVVGDGQGMQG